MKHKGRFILTHVKYASTELFDVFRTNLVLEKSSIEIIKMLDSMMMTMMVLMAGFKGKAYLFEQSVRMGG